MQAVPVSTDPAANGETLVNRIYGRPATLGKMNKIARELA
jgi:hypothetical protein